MRAQLSPICLLLGRFCLLPSQLEPFDGPKEQERTRFRESLGFLAPKRSIGLSTPFLVLNVRLATRPLSGLLQHVKSDYYLITINNQQKKAVENLPKLFNSCDPRFEGPRLGWHPSELNSCASSCPDSVILVHGQISHSLNNPRNQRHRHLHGHDGRQKT